MKPRLVFCLFGSMLVGLLTGAVAVAAGWGLIAGFLLYSLSGSAALVVLSLVLSNALPPVAAAHGEALA